MILHLIRHPKPLIEPGICYGQLDISAENPASIVAQLRTQLPAGLPLWSSPLQRCRILAEMLAEAPLKVPADTAALSAQSSKKLPAQLDARLMELNFGIWEGRPWDLLPRSELDAWAADVEGYAPPNGESAGQLRQRVLAFISALTADECVLVTHAGVIRLLLAHAASESIADSLRYKPDYGSLTTLRLP